MIGSAGLRYLTRTLAALALCLLLLFSATGAQEEISRKIKSKVQPNYPELAKRMNIRGTVKLQIVVAANGTVKNAKIVGGHPLLANAASDAVKKWRFEPASEETTGLVEFRFNPTE